jgi:ribulose-5-phosphate 4-epimerase/fuculose-1-phosphate aldolase
MYDQTSASIDEEIVLVPYGGAVMEELVSQAAATQLGDATMALLENHGVLIVGDSVAKALWRCYVLEWRCNMAWRVETLGGGAEVPDGTSTYLGEIFDRDHQGVFPGLYEYLVRKEIKLDPTVLA